MALPLPPHPDLPAWAERHGLDASRVVAPLDVRPAPTREHPHQVRVDYVVLLTDGSGRMHRDARTMLTCDPPPPHHHSGEPTQNDRIADRLRMLVTRGRVFGVAAFTYETLVATLAGPNATGAVPVGYVAGVEAPTWRPSAKVEQCNACGSRRRGERDDVRAKVRGRDVLVTCTASWHDEPVPQRVTVWCAPCAGPRDVVETFDDQVGVEEQARDVRVRSLDCGHDEVTPIRRATGRCPHVDAPDVCDCAPVIP